MPGAGRNRDRLTAYEFGEGRYIFAESLLTRLYRELDVINNSKDRPEFKRGYRQALELTINWIHDAKAREVREDDVP